MARDAARWDPADPVLARFIDRTTERPTLIGTIGDIFRHAEILRTLAVRDLKLKYRGSLLGFLWSLLNPISLVIVYTFAFKVVLRHPQPEYPYFVLTGVLAWTFFANAASMSTGAITDSAGLVRAARFPRAILPVTTVFFNLAQYLLTLLVFLPIMLIAVGRAPSWPMLMFPVVLALQAAFAVGVALVLSATATMFRDVRHLVEVGLPILFWTTPIVYPIAQVPESLRVAVMLGPMTPFVVSYQRIFNEGLWPDTTALLVAGTYGLGALLLGLIVFRSLEDGLGEQL